MNHTKGKVLGAKIVRLLIPYFSICIIFIVYDFFTESVVVVVPYYWY